MLMKRPADAHRVAFVAPPASYTASSGKAVMRKDIDLVVRALSMGKLHRNDGYRSGLPSARQQRFKAR